MSWLPPPPPRFDLRLPVIWCQLNTLKPGQNDQHSTDNIFKCNFLMENVHVFITILLNIDPRGSIDNKSALVLVKACSKEAPSHYSNPWWPIHWWLYKNHHAWMCCRTMRVGEILVAYLNNFSWKTITRCHWRPEKPGRKLVKHCIHHCDGLMQDCSNSSALPLQSCTKPSLCLLMT